MATHVRTNHVHVVAEAGVKPERIMNDLKSYASRSLNQANFDDLGAQALPVAAAPDGSEHARTAGFEA